MTPAFATAMRRTLAPGGVVHVATDLPGLFDDITGALAQAGFRATADAPLPRPTTKFERKYAQAGTHAAVFAAR